MAEAERFDAFVSYAHEDEPWVTTLAENLHRLGLDVWLDRWEMAGGQLVASRLQDGWPGPGPWWLSSVGTGWSPVGAGRSSRPP
ncbi:hypothetical protein GCM10017589_17680 [Streptomyces poonensis]|nr:hypothetical protein GCM10017589_17680 [Streptomyces poonensis]